MQKKLTQNNLRPLLTFPDHTQTGQQIQEQIQQVAPSPTTVLIQGESGTGKELIAQAIHQHSPRAPFPLVKINCATLVENLLEAELFGYESGAFSAAYQTKPGRFELAEGGTVLLDEIGALSLTAQAKLLRFLQTREYERVGGAQSLQANIRLLTTSNQELDKAIQAGNFRADLYYRISAFIITVPALRKRAADVQQLAEYFLALYAQEQNKKIRRFTADALALLTHYHWPGNIRELQNVIERAVVLCDTNLIHHYHLPPDLQTLHFTTQVAERGLNEAISVYERELLCEALQTTSGNRNQAARLLRISERRLSYKIKKHNIVSLDFR